MAIRVLIEREVKEGQEPKLHQLLMQLRIKAMVVKGYISGETLRSIDNPNKFLVIGTWNSVEDWKAWERHPDRKKFQEEVNQFLTGPEKYTVYTYL